MTYDHTWRFRCINRILSSPVDIILICGILVVSDINEGEPKEVMPEAYPNETPNDDYTTADNII